MKITTHEQLEATYGRGLIDHARSFYGTVWYQREHIRAISGEYQMIYVAGDDPSRFLHVSQDTPGKVAYTKDSGKCSQDIQTRTTLAAYCDKYGLDISTAHTVR